MSDELHGARASTTATFCRSSCVLLFPCSARPKDQRVSIGLRFAMEGSPLFCIAFAEYRAEYRLSPGGLDICNCCGGPGGRHQGEEWFPGPPPGWRVGAAVLRHRQQRAAEAAAGGQPPLPRPPPRPALLLPLPPPPPLRVGQRRRRPPSSSSSSSSSYASRSRSRPPPRGSRSRG